MLAAIRANDDSVSAWEAKKEDGPFRCPWCASPAIFRQGTVIAHHFAHKAKAACIRGSGETEAHRAAKKAIFCALREDARAIRVGLERQTHANGLLAQPDVRFIRAGWGSVKELAVAIEFQRSSLDPRELFRRTAAYCKLNIYVLWVVPQPESMRDGEEYQPRETERYLHDLYGGRLFVWHSGRKVVPVHFDTALCYKEPSEYGSGGNYPSVRYVTPRFRSPIDILNLRPRGDAARKANDRSFPKARLWSL